MENNSLAMETLILCYIESKNLLRTKQLDQGGFNKLLIKSCEGLNYSEEEILSTWRNLVRKYLQVKNNSIEKESWKYFKIMDSCYEVSDFHQCGQSKFSDEMVWFLIECLLKRRDNRKRTQNLERMIEVYHEFLEEGYEILLLNDIQTKWRYMNYRYSKLERIKDAHLKMSYFTAMEGYRKGKKSVKINFTKSLTEILIRKFTEKKVMCNFHGYDSPQLLNEIQIEFQNLQSNAGFDFSCKEIKDKWDKLTYVYDFLKKKHKTESQWMYFHAMREHFEDNVVENGVEPLNTTENVLKKISKSLNKNDKSKLTVVDQFDEGSMSPLNTKKEEENESFDSIASIKTENKKNLKLSDENSELRPLNTTEKVLKKESKSEGEPNKNKKSKLTVIDLFDEKSISSLNSEKGEKIELVDGIALIKTQKVENKKNQKISDENSVVKPLDTTENVLKKRSKSVGETNKNKNSKLTVMDLFDEGSISPLNIEKRDIFESLDNIATIKTQKVENKKNETTSSENISNVSENSPKSNDTSKKKQIFKIKEPKHNSNGDISCALNDHLKVAKPLRTKKYIKSSNENISCSPLKKPKVDKYPKTKKKIKVELMNDNSTSDFSTISLENHSHVNDLDDYIQYHKSEVHINNNESNMDENSCNITFNLNLNTKKCSGNEFPPLPDVDNEYEEHVNSSESVTSQKTEVHINNNESNIDKDGCNTAINFPSITKKFSGNEFLPLKKRLRLNEDKMSLTKEIKDGFRGFSVMDQIHAQSCARAKDFYLLNKEEISAKVTTDMSVTEDMTVMPVTEQMTVMPVTEQMTVMPVTEQTTDMSGAEDTNNTNYTFEENYDLEDNVVSHKFRSPSSFSSPSVVSTERDHHPFPEQHLHTIDLSPEPVSLLVKKVDEIISSLEGDISCDVSNGLSINKDEEIEGDGNYNGVEDGNDPHHIAVHEYEDTSLKENVSTELIETSIVDETITEMEIRSSEYYQKSEMLILHRPSECVESEISRENSIFVEENTNSTTKNIEFSNETIDDANCESPNNNIEYHNKHIENSIDENLETQQCKTESQNYAEETKCNSTSSFPDKVGGKDVANLKHYHKSNLSPPSQCNSSQTGAMDLAENIKSEMKSVRLPVTCGGKLKEIFISPRELSKISKMKPNTMKHLKNPLMMSNGEKYFSRNNCKNMKFMSQVIKEANVTISKNHNLRNDKSNETLNNGNIIQPVPKVFSSTGIVDTNQSCSICPEGEVDGISVISSTMDDEQLSDDLLSDVIDDFQTQSNQELKDIKKLIKENNLLQRETNRILRQILEKL